MDDSHTKKDQIATLMESSLVQEAKLTEEELSDLLKLLERDQRLLHTDIPPTQRAGRQVDPRLHTKEYREVFLARRLDLCRYPGLTVRKLVVVLDLNWTLVHTIAYPDQQALPLLPRALEPQRLRCGSRNFLVVPRPGLVDFLRRLEEFAMLVLWSAASEEYVEAVVEVLGLRPFFSAVVGDQPLAKSLSLVKDRLGVNLDRASVFVFDDQVNSWSTEDQANLIPSMRFAPLRPYDQEFEQSPLSRGKTYVYIYDKFTPGYYDYEQLFYERDKSQFDGVLDLLSEVYRRWFCSNYEVSAVSICRSLRRRVWLNTEFSVEELTDPAKKAVLSKVIESLGGRVSRSGKYKLTEHSAEGSANSLTVKELIDRFFMV